MSLSRVGNRCGAIPLQKPWLFVGVGNPGDKYKGTRHNVGYEMIDAFSELVGISVDTLNFKALVGQGIVNGNPVVLAKPQTYMNLCGESAGPLATYYKLPLSRMLVFYDDMTLAKGVLRLDQRGGNGHHLGLRSIIHHFRGNEDFRRLRIGIGCQPGRMDPKAFLLEKFSASDRKHIDVALREGADVLKNVLSDGFDKSAKRFNMEQKYKHIRVETHIA